MNKLIIVGVALILMGCDDKGAGAPGAGSASASTAAASVAANNAPGPASAQGRLAPGAVKDLVQIAIESPDHKTLVAALKAADLVEAMTAPGPFTVFAPSDAAFAKLPKGTVEGLLAPDKKEDLKKILEYHVAVSVYQTKDMKDGQTLGMANGQNVTFHVKDGKVTVNDANIVASITSGNGVIHVIDAVLLPPPKK